MIREGEGFRGGGRGLWSVRMCPQPSSFPGGGWAALWEPSGRAAPGALERHQRPSPLISSPGRPGEGSQNFLTACSLQARMHMPGTTGEERALSAPRATRTWAGLRGRAQARSWTPACVRPAPSPASSVPTAFLRASESCLFGICFECGDGVWVV